MTKKAFKEKPILKHSDLGQLNLLRRSLTSSTLLVFYIYLCLSILTTKFYLNHIYTDGYLLDEGWFRSLIWRNPLLDNPDVLYPNSSYWDFHFSPFLSLVSAISFLIPSFLKNLYLAAFFALPFSIVGFVIFKILKKSNLNAPSALIISLGLGFGGVAFSAIGYPHFEFWGVAFWFCGYYFYRQRNSFLFFLFLVLAATVREDMLGYIGLVFCGLYVSKRKKESLLLGLSCIFASVAILLLKSILFPSVSLLKQDFIGDPIFSHISFSFIDSRIQNFSTITWLIYLIYACLVCLTWILKSYDAFYVLLAFSPWVAFTSLAVMDAAGTLSAYFGFPIWIAIGTSISLLLSDQFVQESRLRIQKLLVVFSLVSLLPNVSPIGIDRVSAARSFGIFDAKLRNLEKSLATYSVLPNLYIDPSLAAINSTLWAKDQVIEQVDDAWGNCILTSPTSTFWGKKLVADAKQQNFPVINLRSDLALIAPMNCVQK